MLYICIRVSVSVQHEGEIFVSLDKRVGQSTEIFLSYGVWGVFLHLALNEKLNVPSHS
jgi:hypothetical protein